jgi:hypothetical protein
MPSRPGGIRTEVAGHKTPRFRLNGATSGVSFATALTPGAGADAIIAMTHKPGMLPGMPSKRTGSPYP